MYDYNQIIPHRLKYYREKYGFTQQEISNQLSIKQSTYANWERGHRVPDINAIANLADIYQTTIDDILGRTDIKKEG